MELLIEREPTLLSYIDGKAFVNSDVPDFLRKPLCVHSSFRYKVRKNDSDLLLNDERDYGWIDRHLCNNHNGILIGLVSALWSGRRSVLVRDSLSKKLYRIKGAALDPYNPEAIIEEDNVRINGGQKLYNVECEARNSSRFNDLLESVGIEPVMTPKGIWKYPRLCKGLRPAASVFEVKGDTRLDELVLVLERLVSQRIKGKQCTYNWSIFSVDTGWFMYDAGFIVGRLKGLMDRNKMVWGYGKDSTNAHWGNVVLYRDADKLKVNLVDLDIAGLKGDYSRREMRKLQKREYKDIITDLRTSGAYSPREIRGKPFNNKQEGYLIPCIREPLRVGFARGYCDSDKKYSNEIDIGRLLDIYHMLRLDMDFAVSKRELNSDRRLAKLVNYWTVRPEDFVFYVNKLLEHEIVTPEGANDMEGAMRIEWLKGQEADKGNLESLCLASE